MKRPLNLILVGASLTSAFFAPLSVQAGSGGQDSFHSIESEADREIIRRQQDTVEAEDAMRRGINGRLDRSRVVCRAVPRGAVGRVLNAHLPGYCNLRDELRMRPQVSLEVREDRLGAAGDVAGERGGKISNR